MRCTSCHAPVPPGAQFCPACGRSVVEPEQPQTAAPAAPESVGNVVYLPAADPSAASHDDAPVPPNVHAHEYQQPPVLPLRPPGSSGMPSQPAAVEPVLDSPGAGFEQNVLGEWVPAPSGAAADGTGLPSWVDLDDHEPRVVGTMIVLGALVSLVGGFTWYGFVLHANEGGGAESGGLVLLASLLWVLYLSLPTEQHHQSLIRRYERLCARMDRFVNPVRAGTERRIKLRRERDRFRAMRNERSRRVNELGEAAYRSFRAGTLDPTLSPNAQRVMAIEQQMLMQDTRLAKLKDAGTEGPPPG